MESTIKTNTMEAGSAAAAMPPQAAPSPNYVPPIPPAPQPMPQMAEGGATQSSYGGNIKAFFADINWLDIALSSFIIAAMVYSIKYHKYMLMIEKSGYTNLSDRLNSLETKVAKKMTEMNATGKGMRRRAVVRL